MLISYPIWRAYLEVKGHEIVQFLVVGCDANDRGGGGGGVNDPV